MCFFQNCTSDLTYIANRSEWTLEHSLERQILPDGQRIHNLVKGSFVAVGVSEASPAWQEYVEHIDILVLQGLKEVTFSSLASMLNTLLEGQVRQSPLIGVPCPSSQLSKVQTDLSCHRSSSLRHADHVKTIVDRAVKDVTIESGLKTCEEVWLSRIFDMHPHCRVMSATGRGEVIIFEELEHHQMTLETMKNNSETGSFLDEVTKWQKKLQVIESVVGLWSQVQEKWVQLEEVFWTDDVCRDLPKEATTFAAVHHDLCAVMKATEQIPNVLQTCTKPGLQDMLGEMNEKLEKCQHALLHNLEQRRVAFPRFFFLPLQDTLKIVCYAHNPDVLNRYLYKVFEHMESLIFETQNGIHVVGSQRIVAVQSFQGEQLYLPEVGEYEYGYGYEYQGSAERSLITPLTERTFLSLSSALSSGAGALCMGPEIDAQQMEHMQAILSSNGLFILANNEHIKLPGSIKLFWEIWDYYIDKETWQFVRWSDSVPLYSVPCGQGIPSQAFVHTVESEQLVYLTSLLSAAGHPVLLLGEAGCGKSMVLNQHLQALYSGDEVEVLQLRVAMNRSTTPQKLWQSLLNEVEWHHGAVHAPLKNRKLLCLVDDLNLAQVDHHGSQPACELMRQLLDCGGGFDPLSFEWKKIKNVAFLATANVNSSARVPKPSQRLLRHYSIFHCPYPR
ncbi:UNVERIFIED_CONTAM: hypothetical protein FKN15_020618 [Acipenser sinensis]